MLSDNLLPCPFCGSQADFDHDDHGWCWISCNGCSVSTDSTRHYDVSANVVLAELWNQRAPAQTERSPGSLSGHDALWNWFGLSYASWLTVPRVLMHAMPDEWQAKMAALLHQYDVAFTNQPDIGTRVQLVDSNNKLIKTPCWIKNYRHPDRRQIESMKGQAL